MIGYGTGNGTARQVESLAAAVVASNFEGSYSGR
jgi:hypothetical protein